MTSPIGLAARMPNRPLNAPAAPLMTPMIVVNTPDRLLMLLTTPEMMLDSLRPPIRVAIVAAIGEA